MTGGVDGVVKDGSGNLLGKRPLRAGRIDTRAINGAIQPALIVGKIGQQV